MREVLQTVEHTIDPSADPLGHAALPLPVLREEIPSEVGYEEAYIHTYRYDYISIIIFRRRRRCPGGTAGQKHLFF